MEINDMLKKIGFNRQQIPKIYSFAERQNMTVAMLLKVALMQYQDNVEPLLKDNIFGCMGD